MISFLHAQTGVGAATPAILTVILVFALPTALNFWPFQPIGVPASPSKGLVDWDYVQAKVPWGVILLLGGGFALSKGCQESGANLLMTSNNY